MKGWFSIKYITNLCNLYIIGIQVFHDNDFLKDIVYVISDKGIV